MLFKLGEGGCMLDNGAMAVCLRGRAEVTQEPPREMSIREAAAEVATWFA